MDISTHINIHFHDNINNKCVLNALVSVLYYLQKSKYANMIYKFGKKLEKITGRLAIDSIIQYWDKAKKYNDGFQEASLVNVKVVNLDKLLQQSYNIHIIVPIMSNGSYNHSVCLMHNLIFDSLKKVALNFIIKFWNGFLVDPLKYLQTSEIPIYNDTLFISSLNINISPME